MDYPLNPNGSVGAVALSAMRRDASFGLMPHPEAYLHGRTTPRWNPEDLPEEGMGLALFRNAVEFSRNESL
jgi:phosphoribosylformylglycinamidine synthase